MTRWRDTLQKRIVIVAVARDENLYINEWIKHHIDLGIDEILLYDNCSTIPLQSEIDKLPIEYRAKVVVEIEPISPNPQYSAYQHGAEYYGQNTEWMANIDIDEFFMCEESLDKILDKPAARVCGALLVCWKFYNANGQIEYEDKPVTERFTRTYKIMDPAVGKSISKPKYVLQHRVHYPVLMPQTRLMTIDGQCHVNAAVNPPVYNGIYLAHYYTKSYEEWLWKMERGSCDDQCLKKYNEFFQYNPDLLHVYDPNLAMLQQSTGHELPTLIESL